MNLGVWLREIVCEQSFLVFAHILSRNLGFKLKVALVDTVLKNHTTSFVRALGPMKSKSCSVYS